jgi:transcriptional regulator with XRE-family HTH domain
MTDSLLYNKIKTLAKSKDLSIRKLCEKVGISQNGLDKTMTNNTLKVETLNKIAEVLEVEINFFFTDTKQNTEIQSIIDYLENGFASMEINKERLGLEYKRIKPDNSILPKVELLLNGYLDLKSENKLLKELLKDKEKVIRLMESQSKEKRK